jgi:DNA modification methylase
LATKYVNSIIIGDCLKILDNLPDNAVDYTLTSPPYNNKTNKIVNKGKSFYNEYEDKKTDAAYEEFLYSVIDKLLRVTKNYIFFNIMYNTDNKEIVCRLMGKYAEHIKDILIWKKPIQPAMCTSVLTHNYEYIFVISKTRENRKYEINFGKQGNYTTCFEEKGNGITNKERFACDGNFAVMSIQVARRIISTFTKKKDLILDPFAGSFTTGVAAKELGRRFLGIELIPKTAEIAEERINSTVESLI